MGEIDGVAGQDVTAPCMTIVARRSPTLSLAVRRRVEALANDIRAEDPAIGRTDQFGANVYKGCGPQAKILIGDSGEIPLLLKASYNRLDYRFGFLAGEGDLVVIGDARNAAFERYQKRLLGLSRLEYMSVATRFDGQSRATPATCLRDETAYARLRRFALQHGGTTLFAYLTSGTVWTLAARLAIDTGCRIGVAGPPPRLSRRTNDKLWFGDVVARLYGSGALPAKRKANGWAALVRHVCEMAQIFDRLVIKVPDSAGSAGNFVLDCRTLRDLAVPALYRHLRAALPARMRGAPFPVAVEVWDADVLTSPSVQVWIPDPRDGEPVVEGIFEQLLIGADGEFAGAAMAELPVDQDAMLGEQAFALSLLFQRLGYFGRCSFDAVLAKTGDDEVRLHWIECNARWGGVSVPMSFANTQGRRCFAVLQCAQIQAPARPFDDALALLGSSAFSQDDVVLLSPDIVEAGSGCHLIAFGDTAAAAVDRARRVLRQLRR